MVIRHTRNAVVTVEEEKLLVPEDNPIDLVMDEGDVVEPSTSRTEVNNTTVSEKKIVPCEDLGTFAR